MERGLAGFYESGDWPYSEPNQPPLTILLFATLSWLWRTVYNVSWSLNDKIPIFPSSFIWFWEQKGMILLVKIPSILSDLGIGWLIYSYFRKKINRTLGLKLAAIWLFNPVSWYNSAIWGQTDGIVNFLGLFSVLTLLERKLILFSVFFTLCLLFKGSLAAFSPILLFIILKQKYPVKEFTKAIFSSVLTALFISFWFHPNLDLPLWIINLYINRILPGEIGYLTANAFNFWWLINPGKILDNLSIFGLPARVWGFLVLLSGIILILNYLNRKLTNQRVFASFSVVTFVAFLFLTRIHERYLFPSFPYLTLLLGFIPNLFFTYLLLSFTFLLNMYNLFWAPSFPPLEKALAITEVPVLFSILNIVFFFYFLRLLRSSKL